jgi:hypothetical protein
LACIKGYGVVSKEGRIDQRSFNRVSFELLTVVFGVRGLIAVSSIVGIATSSISITTSSSIATISIRLPVVGIVVGLRYVLISRHD